MHKLGIAGKSRAPRKKLKSQIRNWLPNQHDAWFIVVVPTLFGASLSSWVWQHALLLAMWIIGFFFIFPTLWWIKSPRRKTLRIPVVVYDMMVSILGMTTLVALPLLAWWIPVFAVIIGIWVEEIWRERERELGARLSVVVAAGLMTLVAYHCGLMGTALWMGQGTIFGIHEAPVLGGHTFSSDLRGRPAAGVVVGELVAYFTASVPYVEAIFRRCEDHRFLVASAISHTVYLVAAVISALLYWVSPLVVVTWLVALGCAIWFPWQTARRGKPWKPRMTGFSEVAISVLVSLATMLWAMGPETILGRRRISKNSAIISVHSPPAVLGHRIMMSLKLE